MNVLSITIAKSFFIDAYVSVTIQLPSSVQYGTSERRAVLNNFFLILHVFRLYHIALKTVTGWLSKRMHQ